MGKKVENTFYTTADIIISHILESRKIRKVISRVRVHARAHLHQDKHTPNCQAPLQ